MFDILKNSLENYRKEQEINNLIPLAPLKTKVKEWLKIDYKEKIFTKEKINEIIDMIENLMVNEGLSTINAYHMACELIMGDESVSQCILDMEGIVNETI